MPRLVTAKNASIASEPTKGRCRTEASSTGFEVNAAANSGVPLLPTIALQSAPGVRAKLSCDIVFPGNLDSKNDLPRPGKKQKRARLSPQQSLHIGVRGRLPCRRCHHFGRGPCRSRPMTCLVG